MCGNGRLRLSKGNMAEGDEQVKALRREGSDKPLPLILKSPRVIAGLRGKGSQ